MERKLERQIELTKDNNENKIIEPMRLEYYLLQTEMTDLEEARSRQGYGIEIVKRSAGAGEEAIAYRDIFGSRESTMALLEKLARNSVTPVTFPYILDDLLGA